MDLGLDDYSSDSDSQSHSDNEDVPVFELLTMSTAPKVDSFAPVFAAQSGPNQATIGTKQPSQQHQSSTSTFKPHVVQTELNPTLFKRDFHLAQKKAREQQSQKDERHRKYLQLKDKFKSKAPLTPEEALEAARLGFESEYSDAGDEMTASPGQSKSTGTNGGGGEAENPLLSFDAKSAAVKRARVNLDATSDDYTGSWGLYEGEAENKARISKLNVQKKQKQSELQEQGIDEAELKRLQYEEAQKTTSEVSSYYLPVDPEFSITSGSTSQYVSFDFNTPEYIDTIYRNRDMYKSNTSRTPQDVRKQIADDEMKERFGKYNKDQEDVKTQCYDTYHDILLSGIFKTPEIIPVDATKSTANTPQSGQHGKTGTAAAAAAATTTRLKSFLEPKFGTKIDRTSVLLNASQFESKYVSKSLDKPFLHYQPESNGANFVRFFPYTSSHIIVGCLDGSVKLYPTSPSESRQGNQGCIRAYKGHEKGLSELTWVDDGKRFVTCSLDGWVKLWDTETGKVLFRENTTIGLFKSNATPMAAVVDATTAMIGCGNGHIMSYDFRSNEIVMDYAQMQQSITTMVEVPGGARKNIMCAAGDGNIYVYEWGIPSIYQYVMQHGRQMVTRACVHPSEQFIVANTHSNNIALFKIENGKVKLNRKKTFQGHTTAGYSLGVCCSPDGKYVVSGDGHGRLSCWEFRTGKLISQHKTHSKVLSDVDWAWNHPTMFSSCSWDGQVKVFK